LKTHVLTSSHKCIRTHRRIAELEAEVTRLKSGATAPGVAPTTPPTSSTTTATTEAEAERLRNENAQLVGRMREILIRYKAMQEQLSNGGATPATTASSSSSAAAAAEASGKQDGGEGPAAGAESNEQKLVGKLKAIVGKYKDLQAAAKVIHVGVGLS
jgi:hypothetical protein